MQESKHRLRLGAVDLATFTYAAWKHDLCLCTTLQVLAPALVQHPSIRELDLSGWYIGDAGIQDVCRIMITQRETQAHMVGWGGDP